MTENINYKVVIESGQSTIDSNVILSIFGDQETTPNLGLTTTKDGVEAKFEKNSTLEFDLKTIDVGKIKKINIGHDGKGTEQQWYIKTIQIEKSDEQYIFNANQLLSEDKTYIDLIPDEENNLRSSTPTIVKKDQSTYIITVVTSTDDEGGTDSGVLMSIFGDKDSTKQFQLITTKQGVRASFESGTTNEFEMKLDDVGKINKITVGQDGKGSHQKWHLESIQIQKESDAYNFVADKILDRTTSFIDLTPSSPKKASTPEPANNRAPSPEPVQIEPVRSEPVRTKTPTPEPVKARSPSPEPVKARTPSPEPVKTKAPSPEPVKSKAPSPEPVKPKQINSEPVKSKTPSPEPIKNKAPSPEPVKSKAPSPEPVKPKQTNSEPVKAKTPSPEPVKPKQTSPEPVKPKTSEQKTPRPKESKYKVSIQSNANDKDHSNFYIIIYGQDDETDKLYFKNSIKSDKNNELEFQTHDVGKVSKVILGQDKNENEASCHINNITIKRNNDATTFNAEQTIEPDSEIELFPSAIPKKTEAVYRIFVRTGTEQEEGNDSHLHIVINGRNGQTKKKALDETTKVNKKVSFKKDDKIEFEFKSHDVGKITKIIVYNEQGIVWHINNITIKRNSEITTFNVERKIEANSQVELTPSPIQRKIESPRKPMKTSEIVSKIVVKPNDTDYHIIISTGGQAIQDPVTLKIRGDDGSVKIPLTKTTAGDKPFQSNSTQEFTSHTSDVGKIKRLTIEHDGTDEKLVWHIKTIQIKKGNETYSFNANIRLDYKENRVNLYPIGTFYGHQKEDYVQSELRRLRENLRTESAKLRPPTHKAYEPFVYNDLSPYFDTSAVERAIYSPFDAPPGYHTRITALRIVEPYEAHGMDYGVSYKLSKQRKNRSISANRPGLRSADSSVDRKQGSTHLPKFPCVDMRKPVEYSRALTVSDVPKIRELVRSRYTTQASNQIKKDYKRTHDDIYRMELDNINAYHQTSRENMLRLYHSYLENTPGSKKAVRELSERLAGSNTKQSLDTTV